MPESLFKQSCRLCEIFKNTFFIEHFRWLPLNPVEHAYYARYDYRQIIFESAAMSYNYQTIGLYQLWLVLTAIILLDYGLWLLGL